MLSEEVNGVDRIHVGYDYCFDPQDKKILIVERSPRLMFASSSREGGPTFMLVPGIELDALLNLL